MNDPRMLPDNRIRSVVVSATEERRTVTGLIVSTEFCNEIVPKLYLEYLTNSYLRKVADWCVNFYEHYGTAPLKHIKDIYEDNIPKLDAVEGELIKKLLISLSDQYDDASSLNVEYLIESSINYFRKRELEIHQNNITVLLNDGKIDEAEEEVARFQAVSLDLDDSLYLDLGNEEQRKELYEKYEKKQRDFFKMPGDFGDFIGVIKQGDVVGIVAPAKKGKSFLLNDFMKHLIIQKRKVVKFAIEMTDIEELIRFDKMFFPVLDKIDNANPEEEIKTEKVSMIPCFDCLHNQTGECVDRLSTIIVRDYGAPDFEYKEGHTICTKCRGTEESDRFIAVPYIQPITRKSLESHTMITEMRKFSSMLSKYSKIVVRPKYSLSYDLLMYDLDVLYKKFNFIPQAILFLCGYYDS